MSRKFNKILILLFIISFFWVCSRIRLKMKLTNKTDTPLTVVSAYFDISRTARPKEQYFKWIPETAKINAPFVFFTQARFKNIIKDLFPKNKELKIICIELENLYFYQDIDLIKKIHASDYYKRVIQAPDRIECYNPLYSIVQFSKFEFLLKSARANYFNSKKFLWIDAGINRYWDKWGHGDRELTAGILPEDKFYITLEKTRYNNSCFMQKNYSILFQPRSFVLGGLFGGSLKSIEIMVEKIKNKWKWMLNEQKIVTNEQFALLIEFFENPQLFHYKEIQNAHHFSEVLIHLK